MKKGLKRVNSRSFDSDINAVSTVMQGLIDRRNINPVDDIDNELDAINLFIKNTIKKHNITFEQVIELLSKKTEKTVLIPSYILRNRKLGILEATTKYLKEEHKLSYHDIAVLLKRDDRVIWTTYNKAKKKVKTRLQVKEPNCWLPISIFCDKKGPLEAVTIYLKDKMRLTFNEIAKLLNRDNRTVWAVYNKKGGKK